MGVLNGIFTFMSYFLFILFIFLSYCFQLFNNLIVFLIFSLIFIFATPYIYNKLKNQKIIINNKLYLLSYFLLMSYGILITLRYVFDSYVYNNIEYFVFKCLLFMFLMFVLNILGKVMNGYQLEKDQKL